MREGHGPYDEHSGGLFDMAFMTWTHDLELGIPQIDRQHRRLVELLNALEAGVRDGYSRRILGSILSDLARYTVCHFTFEERLMETYHLPDSEEHKEEHRNLATDVLNFKMRFDVGHADVSDELLLFLRSWLQGHILGTDRALVDALKDRLNGASIPVMDVPGCCAA